MVWAGISSSPPRLCKGYTGIANGWMDENDDSYFFKLVELLHSLPWSNLRHEHLWLGITAIEERWLNVAWETNCSKTTTTSPRKFLNPTSPNPKKQQKNNKKTTMLMWQALSRQCGTSSSLHIVRVCVKRNKSQLYKSQLLATIRMGYSVCVLMLAWTCIYVCVEIHLL